MNNIFTFKCVVPDSSAKGLPKEDRNTKKKVIENVSSTEVRSAEQKNVPKGKFDSGSNNNNNYKVNDKNKNSSNNNNNNNTNKNNGSKKNNNNSVNNNGNLNNKSSNNNNNNNKSNDIKNNNNNNKKSNNSNSRYQTNSSHNSSSTSWRNANFNQQLQPGNQSNNTTTTSTSVTISEVVRRFWHRLEEYLKYHNETSQKNLTKIENILNVNDEAQIALWMQCWSAGSNTNINGVNLSVLPKMLLILPDSKTVLPPPSYVIKVLSSFTDSIHQCISNWANLKPPNIPNKTNNHININPFFNDLEVIVNVVRDRLNGPNHLFSTNYLDIETSEMIKLINQLGSKFRETTISAVQNFPTDCSRLGQLMIRQKDFSDFEQSINNLQQINNTTQAQIVTLINKDITSSNTNNTKAIKNEKPWLGWKDHATVGWLLSTDWLDIPELTSRYEDSKEYAESMLRIWTLLSFYWGAGAVWPKCSHKDNKRSDDDSMCCGQPLLTRVLHHHTKCTMRYNGRTCDTPASWKCFRYNHDAICDQCLYKQQMALISSRGLHASTDIYDATIERETIRRDGSIYVASKLNSRKPPKIAPNWKNTYRLQPSQLVGIIKLGSSNEPLKKSYDIYWGEIVPVDPKNLSLDWQARANGKVAFRLLSRNDISVLSTDDTVLDLGTCIAIIDLRVFVPEVISVLATFAQDAFPSHLAQIPFINCLIGQSTGYRPNFNMTNSKQLLITEAIKSSEIELITRLPPLQLQRFIQRICQLKQVETLYGTQLEAFIAGLAGAVHCTQGPPGTGKVCFS